MTDKTERQLPADVAKEYECVNNNAGIFLNTPIGRVDFTKITLKQAEDLVKKEFPFIRKLESKKKNATS